MKEYEVLTVVATFCIGSLVIGMIAGYARYLITGKKFWHPHNE